MTDLPDIRIHKLNHATIRIECEMDIALEMSETFSFEVKGAKFSPAFKMGKWDGKIRLFNLGSRTMGSGLYRQVLDFARIRDYTTGVIDNFEETGYESVDYVTPNINEEVIGKYMTELNLYARGEPLELRDYQIKGVTVAIRDRQAILLACTGAGKSAILYGISRYITEELDGRVLVLVPTVGLTTQLKSDFMDYSSHNGYGVDESMHLISAGADKNVNKPIVVSTFQSLKDVTKEWINSFSAIITDEGHKITAASFKTIYDKATDVPFRLACTGTLHELKANILEMNALTGPVHTIALAKDLIAAKQLVPLRIKAISLNYPLDICKGMKGVDYDQEIKWITQNPKRNNFIKKLALSCKGSTLILFRFIEQGQILYDTIKAAVGDTRDVFFIDGSISKEDRERIRLAANLSDAILIFSYATSSTGLNLPAISNIIDGHPVRSKLTFLQSIGRGLRLKEGKTHCNLFTIGDNMTYKAKTNTSYKHFGERLKMLLEEGYDFDMVNVEFK
jgi:superfamily II DNA or RNA helicase